MFPRYTKIFRASGVAIRGTRKRTAGNEPRTAGNEPRRAGNEPRTAGNEPRPDSLFQLWNAEIYIFVLYVRFLQVFHSVGS